MDNFLTATLTHLNNPTGTAWATVASDQPCSPVDPLGREYVQQYPIEKLYLMCQTFTAYAAVKPGDRVVTSTVTYDVKSVNHWPAQGGLTTYYHLILEKKSGS